MQVAVVEQSKSGSKLQSLASFLKNFVLYGLIEVILLLNNRSPYLAHRHNAVTPVFTFHFN